MLRPFLSRTVIGLAAATAQSMSKLRLRKMLYRAGMREQPEERESVAEHVLSTRDTALALHSGSDSVDASDHMAELARKLADEQLAHSELKKKCQRLEADLEDTQDNFQHTLNSESKYRDMVTAVNKVLRPSPGAPNLPSETGAADSAEFRALRGCRGYDLDVRHTGELLCKTRPEAHQRKCREAGRDDHAATMAISEMQGWIDGPKWYPVKRDCTKNPPVEMINWQDSHVQRIKAKHGDAMVKFVVGCWQERQKFNASGGYLVPVLWHKEEDRELTPAEAVERMIQQWTVLVGSEKGKRR
jgi:hypothetical protein